MAKKNRNLLMQVESLKTKAAKAAEIAIKLSQDKDGNITGKVEGSTSININFGGGDPVQRAAAAQARSGMPSGHVRTR